MSGSTWGLPARGHVQGLITEFAGVEEMSRHESVGRAQLPGLVGGVHRKTPAHLAGFGGVFSFGQRSGRD